MATTKHNHQMIFGQRETDCPRCDELRAGAPIRQAPWFARVAHRKAQEALRIEDIRNHDFAACEKRNIVCTCFDW